MARTALGMEAALVRGDMRELPFGSAFDVVFNFFTSFGYFVDDGDNCRAAVEIARVLKPGGVLYMDFMNVAHDLPNLVPESVRISGPWRFRERRWHDAVSNRVNKHVEAWRDGVLSACFTESVRAYTCEELTALFAGAGMILEKTFGACDGRSYLSSSPRMILLFRKRMRQ
jgi:SAM-dependent methyltransferase